jgi:methylthioribulose-1-phosphate dehydratase
MADGRFSAVASDLVEVGRRFYTRGWALGTSGNFSVVTAREPLRIAITASSLPKGQLRKRDILECDEHAIVVTPESTNRAAGKRTPSARRRERDRHPSAETLLHIEIARVRGAGAILHTHSVWTTMLSDVHGHEGGVRIEGYEMLKGLNGVTSHEHREWIPIIANDQDMPRLARQVRDTLTQYPDAHAFVLQRHGLYTWGDTLQDAERHVEILEFLFETLARMAGIRDQGSGIRGQGARSREV